MIDIYSKIVGKSNIILDEVVSFCNRLQASEKAANATGRKTLNNDVHHQTPVATAAMIKSAKDFVPASW